MKCTKVTAEWTFRCVIDGKEYDRSTERHWGEWVDGSLEIVQSEWLINALEAAFQEWEFNTLDETPQK